MAGHPDQVFRIVKATSFDSSRQPTWVLSQLLNLWPALKKYEESLELDLNQRHGIRHCNTLYGNTFAEA